MALLAEWHPESSEGSAMAGGLSTEDVPSLVNPRMNCRCAATSRSPGAPEKSSDKEDGRCEPLQPHGHGPQSKPNRTAGETRTGGGERGRGRGTDLAPGLGGKDWLEVQVARAEFLKYIFK